MIDKVKDLFHGHPELILGFNTFLPKVGVVGRAGQAAGALLLLPVRGGARRQSPGI